VAVSILLRTSVAGACPASPAAAATAAPGSACGARTDDGFRYTRSTSVRRPGAPPSCVEAAPSPAPTPLGLVSRIVPPFAMVDRDHDT
jgi:hypothetical protein